MHNKNITIVLATGGTGGHLFPAIAVAEELSIISQAKGNGYRINTHLITDMRCQSYLPANLPAQTHIINFHLKTATILKKFISALKLTRAYLTMLPLLYKIGADIVIGFGGYPSFPVLLAARTLGIKIVIHEQNCILGKSNRFFAKYAELIALSYPKTQKVPQHPNQQILVTGDIVRSSIHATKQYNAYHEPFNIFIFGGSQGAKIFGTLIPHAIKELLKIDPKLNITITQQVPQAEQLHLQNQYDALGIQYTLSTFFHNMSDIYHNSQLVIARAGATTIAELTAATIPAILIPYPFASENHQFYNAQAIHDIGGGWCCLENTLNPVILAQKIHTLMSNRDLLTQCAANLRVRYIPHAAKHFIDTVLKIIT